MHWLIQSTGRRLDSWPQRRCVSLEHDSRAMTRCFIRTMCISIFMLGIATFFAGIVVGESSLATKTDLCVALEGIKDGERLPIIVSGVYAASPEMKVLYNPNMPLCQEDVQPSTWVVLKAGADSNAKLGSLLRQGGRAYVTLKGTLEGPQQGPPLLTILLFLFLHRTRVELPDVGMAILTNFVQSSSWTRSWRQRQSPQMRRFLPSGKDHPVTIY